MPSVALFSSDYAQTTGQALVTRRVVEHVLPSFGRYREYVYRPTGAPKAIASWLSAWSRLWWDVAGRRIDTLYLICSRSNAGFIRDIPALLLARLGVRVVVHAHGSDIVGLLRSRPLSPLARWLYSRCELVIPSRHLIDPLQDIRLQGLHLCENFAIATDKRLRSSALSERLPLKVLWNSNVMASKGVFDVMLAVQNLTEGGADIDLQMIGALKGDEELPQAATEERFAALSCNERVSHHGRVSTRRAIDMVNESDVIALPSRYSSECQPLAVIQAMCAGRAVVVSDIPALQATLGNYPGEIAPKRDIDALTAVLHQLYEEKKANPSAFWARREEAAAVSRKRFSVNLFDERMQRILAEHSSGLR